MPDLNLTVESSGPIFQKSTTNKRINDVTRAFIQRMVELGEQRLDEILVPRPAGVFLSVQEARPNQASTGNYRGNISGRVQGMTGIIDDGKKVVYGPWLEGTSSRNAATQFKGYAAFRKTKDWMDSHAKIIRKVFERNYARRLNGI